MIDVETELKELTPEDFYRLYAEGSSSGGCAAARRAGGRVSAAAIRSACCRRFADWAEAVKEAAQRDRDARDPAAEGLRSELGRRLRRLAETMRNES